MSRLKLGSFDLIEKQTTCLHILLNKPVLHATFLRNEAEEDDVNVQRIHEQKILGQGLLGFLCIASVLRLQSGGESTYMCLILAWACPVLLLLWSLAYQLISSLPRSKTLLAVLLPTLYLWIVDTIALRRGTWNIMSGTKLGFYVWPYLEIEEATFFLVTNLLVVAGSCAFDNAIAIMDVFPEKFRTVPPLPSPAMMIRSLLIPSSEYDTRRLRGLRSALKILAKKSRSFYLASGVFSGRLRIDLVLLYAFCRIADDLIDNAPDAKEAEKWIRTISHFLDVAFSSTKNNKRMEEALAPFSEELRSVLVLLPVTQLPSQPLYDLLEGFRIDLKFHDKKSEIESPIQTYDDLERYATCVAATIGELCLNLVYYHDPDKVSVNPIQRQKCLTAGTDMGRVLQYVNIVRDVNTDAANGRIYLPNEWIDKEAADAGPQPFAAEILRLRKKLLRLAFVGYSENRDAIEELPAYARNGIRVAVESYMEIGRVMDERMRSGLPLDFVGSGKAGRASVPSWRRLWVGWSSMAGIQGRIGKPY